MQVAAITNQNFTAKKRSRENIDRFIELGDEDLRLIALANAKNKHEKARKNINRAWLSVPVIAYFSSAILNKGNAVKILNKTLTGRSANLMAGLKGAGSWAFGLGTAALTLGIFNKIEDKSEKFKNFRQNHPFLSVTGDIATMLGALTLIPMAAKKGFNKIKPEKIAKLANTIEAKATTLNNFKLKGRFLNSIKNAISFVNKKVANNGFTSLLLNEAPFLTMLGTVVASVTSGAAFANNFKKSYENLKVKQEVLADARRTEEQVSAEDM